jgi:hypothetical protein
MKLRILVVVPVLLVAASCARGNGGGTTPAAPTSTCASSVIITAENNGQTICVAKGGKVELNLVMTPPVRWTPIEADGTGLVPATSDQQGTGRATYTAMSAGTTVITTSRPNCPTVQSGMSCHSIMAWKVTVEVK